MSKQRTLFFGKIPQKSPKKDGENLPVNERRFAAVRAREMEIRFTNTTATQFGGYPLWDGFLKEAGIDARLAHHIKMNRGEGFTAPELSRFFMDACVLGCERLMHVDRMRYDPMLTHAFGIDGLPSDETVGRYFKSFGQGHLESLDRLNVRVNNREWKTWRRGLSKKKRQESEGIILDYDTSTMTVYGKQEGADRGRCFRKKDKPGFQPKFAFVGGLGVMVNQELHPQSRNLGSDFESFHWRTVGKLPKTARIWAIRGDGGLYSEERVEWAEEQGYTYAISAARTEDLKGVMHEVGESVWEEGMDERGHHYSIARIRYRPKTWKKARTFILSRREKELRGQQVLWEWQKYKYFAYVTDVQGSLLSQFKFCVQRCSLEGFIKEGKRGFHYDFLPHRELDANRAYLLHIQLAYNLFIWWKLLAAPSPVNRWGVETFRRRLLTICGNVRKRMGRWVLSLPRWWPWRTVYWELALAGGLSPP